MRVWNDDVFENPDGVAEAVLVAFALAPPPHPIRLREGSAGSTSGRRKVRWTYRFSPFDPAKGEVRKRRDA